jgi:hypothetical protein
LFAKDKSKRKKTRGSCNKNTPFWGNKNDFIFRSFTSSSCCSFINRSLLNYIVRYTLPLPERKIKWNKENYYTPWLLAFTRIREYNKRKIIQWIHFLCAFVWCVWAREEAQWHIFLLLFFVLLYSACKYISHVKNQFQSTRRPCPCNFYFFAQRESEWEREYEKLNY